jgi:CrcB protein
MGYLSVLFNVDWRLRHGTAVNAGVLTGVLGGYTTFSSMQLDAVKLTGTSGRLPAGFYLLLSVALGQVAAWLGGSLARAQA